MKGGRGLDSNVEGRKKVIGTVAGECKGRGGLRNVCNRGNSEGI